MGRRARCFRPASKFWRKRASNLGFIAIAHNGMQSTLCIVSFEVGLVEIFTVKVFPTGVNTVHSVVKGAQILSKNRFLFFARERCHL